MKKSLLLLTLLLFTSCLSSSYTPTTTYDLQPAADATEVNFSISQIELDGPYSKKLTYKQGNTLIEKEYHRWSDEPHVILRRYWTLGKTSANPRSIKKAIVRVFEFNQDMQAALIIIDIESDGKIKRLKIKEAYEGDSELVCVAAMKTAVEKLTQKISSLK